MFSSRWSDVAKCFNILQLKPVVMVKYSTKWYETNIIISFQHIRFTTDRVRFVPDAIRGKYGGMNINWTRVSFLRVAAAVFRCLD